VGVAAAGTQSFPVELDALGTVAPVATAVVRAQVSGVVQQVLFSEGQIVQRGQLLALIDPRPFENALMQVKGQLQRDEAQLENARVTERRYRQLQAQDSIAQQDVDAQTALVKQLEGTVAIDRAAVRSAQLNLDFARITAPLSGRIGLRSIDVGNLVGPSDATGLVTITQTAPIDVVFAVPQDAVPELKHALAGGKALPVTALDRSRSKPLAVGRFLALDNVVDTQTGTVRAKARFDNANGGLFPNQFVNIRLKLRTIEGATAVPVSAVRNGGDGPFVYVLNPAEKTVKLRAVKRGLSNLEHTQILSGVEPGEQVITEGADRLTDGAKVKLPGERDSSRGAAGREERPGGEKRRHNASGG
jgi:multidrug efflux system membrane fusion protein